KHENVSKPRLRTPVSGEIPVFDARSPTLLEAVDEDAIGVEACNPVAAQAVGHGELAAGNGLAIGLQGQDADQVIGPRRKRVVEATVRMQARDAAAAVSADGGEQAADEQP